MPERLQAGLWGALAGSALVLGSVAALTLNVPRRVVALIMAFGGGALVNGPELRPLRRGVPHRWHRRISPGRG